MKGVSLNSLNDRLDFFPEAWRPNPGEKLIGTVVDLSTRESEYSPDPYPIIHVATERGEELCVHGFHTVLKSELEKLQPRIGDRIGIAYHGRSDRGYERYRVIVERQLTAPAQVDPSVEAAPATQLTAEGPLPF
jgi:hypothetical protein